MTTETMNLAPWVSRMLDERGVTRDEFLVNLARGLAESHCARCANLHPREGCGLYDACRAGGHEPKLFEPGLVARVGRG